MKNSHSIFHRAICWCKYSVVCGLLLCSAIVAAQQAKNPGELIVGTKVAPPFSMSSESGEWTGISIELMELVAEKIGLSVSWKETSLEKLVSDIEGGQLDASIAAISITPAREERIDFSHQFFGSGLSIVTLRKYEPGWKNALSALVSPQFLATILLLCSVLAFVGVVIWMLERKRNESQFGASPARGIGNGFWFAAVTMTTVGYGDKAPVTFTGRFVSVIWMFAALILTAFLTAQLTTILTAQQAKNIVQSQSDLPHAKIGVLRSSSSLDYFRKNNIEASEFGSVQEGLTAVSEGDVDAFVHDQPLLKWLVSRDDRLLQVLPDLFDPQGYAIAVAQDSPLREKVNIALLQILSSEKWKDIRKRYLGE